MERRHIILIANLLVFCVVSASCNSADTTYLKLRGRCEIGFTPRFVLFQKYALDTTTVDYYDFTGIFRLQIGYHIANENYLYICYDYFVHRTNNAKLGADYGATGLGIAYSRKFTEAAVSSKSFRIYEKKYIVRVYPELNAFVGLSNLGGNYSAASIAKQQVWSPYYSYGIGLNFYVNI